MMESKIVFEIRRYITVERLQIQTLKAKINLHRTVAETKLNLAIVILLQTQEEESLPALLL